MTTKQIIGLLSDKKIKVVEDGNKIFYDERINDNIPLLNHYAILQEDDKWVFASVIVERTNTPETIIERIFDTKHEALIYFFLYLLDNYYIMNYVLPLSDVSLEEWNFDTILRVMDKNNIPRKYFSYNNIKNENSAYYYEENGEWFRAYIGNSGSIIAKNETGFSMEEKNWFLSLSLNDIYPLYLLDKYEEVLLKHKEIEKSFSDVERARFLGYKI